jgi:hypothetical protein
MFYPPTSQLLLLDEPRAARPVYDVPPVISARRRRVRKLFAYRPAASPRPVKPCERERLELSS